MKINKKVKKISAAVIALGVVLSSFVIPKVQAALKVDLEKECSIQFETGDTFGELKSLDIPVKVYQVADISEEGNYTPHLGFESLSLDTINNETKAEEWEAKAAKATEIIQENSESIASAQGNIMGGVGVISKLPVGMYLVVAEIVDSPFYTYSFQPYLLSLPNNYYYSQGNDDWVYEVTTGLKPEQEVRYGDLLVNKTLTSYNATFGGADFVFSVEAVFEEEVVYSDVVTISFDGTGTESTLVEKIPAGSVVTITEIYSGSSYELVSEASQVTEIIADDIVEVAFVNTYNHGVNGGSSVVNHFRYTPEEIESENATGTWDWEAQNHNNSNLE